MPRVKICGMSCREDVEVCVASGVDALGFIFAPGPRMLSLDAASELTHLVPPFVTTVGVFAGNDKMLVREAVRRCRLDVLQFCGDETPQFCGSFEKPTVMVMHVAGSASRELFDGSHLPDLHSLRQARAVAVLADSGIGNKPGGTGIRIADAQALALRRWSPLPFVLAGGLTALNVGAAVMAVQPWAVDVRSGVERSNKKDRRLVAAFVRAAKEGNRDDVA